MSIIRDQIEEMMRQGCTCPYTSILAMISKQEGELPVYTFRHRNGCPYMRVETAPQLTLPPRQLPVTT